MSGNNLYNAYENSYQLACQCLCGLSAESVAKNSGAVVCGDVLFVNYMGQVYAVNVKTGEVSQKGAPQSQVPVTTRVLILHYLINADGTALTGRPVAFKELAAGGAIYDSNFEKRAVGPLIKRFSNDLDALYTAAELLGGRRAERGHGAVEIDIFPFVPATYIVWQGDDEIPSSGTILFDSSIENYLPVEDVVVAASNCVYTMIKLV